MRIDYNKYYSIGWLPTTRIKYKCCFITKPFWQEALKIKISNFLIRSIFADFINNKSIEDLIFLYENEVYIIHINSIMNKGYHNEHNSGSFHIWKVQGDGIAEDECKFSAINLNGINDFKKEDEDYKSFGENILKVYAYYKYAPIEISIINNGGKRKDVNKNISYVNCLGVQAQILNSNWNKIIIRKEGFGVNGHFRLQPCGEGLKQKKLIWINEFQKNGYARIAGKLKEAQ